MKTLTVKMSDQLFAEIAAAARVRNVSKSEIARERLTVRTNGKEAPSMWDLIEDLVVPWDNGPTDLSSNKAHLKDYGKARSDR